MTIALIILILLVLNIMVYAYRVIRPFAKELLSAQKEITQGLSSLQESIQIMTKQSNIQQGPQFTCYYCNNRFPKSQQIQIAGYLYCEEHANRGHRIRQHIA